MDFDDSVLQNGLTQTMGDGDDGPAPGGRLQGADDAGFGIRVEIGRNFIKVQKDVSAMSVPPEPLFNQEFE